MPHATSPLFLNKTTEFTGISANYILKPRGFCDYRPSPISSKEIISIMHNASVIIRDVKVQKTFCVNFPKLALVSGYDIPIVDRDVLVSVCSGLFVV